MPEKKRGRGAPAKASRSSKTVKASATRSRGAGAQAGRRSSKGEKKAFGKGARTITHAEPMPAPSTAKGGLDYTSAEEATEREPDMSRSTAPGREFEPTSATGGMVDQSLQECIDDCLDCHSLCLQTVTHSLQMSGPRAETDHIRLLLDCADICQTSADFMLRGSGWYERICAVCAEVCERCAEACERFGDDAQMRDCAEACRRCAESCRRLAVPMAA